MWSLHICSLEETRENVEETNENIEETNENYEGRVENFEEANKMFVVANENIEETIIENTEETTEDIKKQDIPKSNLCRGQRWSEEDTNALIDAYEKFKVNFSIAKSRSRVWDMIEDYLATNGVSVCA